VGLMPPGLLPGKQGTDYHYVRYGDHVYVVYRVKLPDGRYINTSWRVRNEDFKALGVDPSKVGRIGKAQFQNLNIFGTSEEIARGNRDEHPFQQYLHQLRQQYGNVSWFDNKEFVSTMLAGWAENMSASELEQQLKQTKWYQTRTDRARQWELEFTREERQQETSLWKTRIMDTLDDLYGVAVSWKEAGVTAGEVNKAAKAIASGRWGDPSEGLETWLRRARARAEKVEGSAAWVQRQQEGEQQRAYANRPEDIAAKIREEAFSWLGPRGVPDNATIRDWSERLASERASDGDWQSFLKKQATSLYPWLGPEERWQDRASSYKKIVEDAWGKPIGWDNDMLAKIGGVDANGAPTNAATSYDDFERVVRSRPEFWGGPTAKQEGFELFNYLNSTFNGVQS
jgi:hypothetical protein